MWFPNAEVTINPALLVFLGIIVGTLGGFFGVGGGFLITGGLLVFGVPPLFAVGTGLTLVMGTSLINTLKHRSLGNVDFKLGLMMAAGSVPALYGAQQLNHQLEAAGIAGPVIRVLYVFFLSVLGTFILYDHWRVQNRSNTSSRGESKDGVSADGVGADGVRVDEVSTAGLARWIQRLNIGPRSIWLPGFGKVETVVSLPVSGVERISVFVPVLLGAGVGSFAGILGAGGAFILTPLLIYVVGIPTVVAIGTGLFQVILTGSVGTFFYALSDRVDPLMAVLMLAAAAIGAQLGTSATRVVQPSQIRFLFGVIVLTGGLAVGLEEIAQVTEIDVLSTVAAVVLLGIGGAMCLGIGVLMIKAKRKTHDLTSADD
ncbi:MAG: sulfite exporter TauE/SafE family protein [SAR202 cluster bacterium]|nr:sulfite exporter TauE/SafE family protein [SAR202 cluster bacterium]